MTLTLTHTGLGIKFNIIIYSVVQVISMKGIIRVFSETIGGRFIFKPPQTIGNICCYTSFRVDSQLVLNILWNC